MDPTFRRVLDRLTASTSRLAEIGNSDLARAHQEIALLRDENLRMRDELRKIDEALNDPAANVFDTTADCIVRLREERDTLQGKLETARLDYLNAEVRAQHTEACRTRESADALVAAIRAHYERYQDRKFKYDEDVYTLKTTVDGRVVTHYASWCGYFERIEDIQIDELWVE